MTEPAITLGGFFEQVRAGQLTGIRCGACGELAVPPKEFCPSCHQRAWQPQRLSGNGTIASYTVIRVAPTRHAPAAPYALAIVKLTEGVSLLGRLLDIPLDKLAVGLPVRFRPLVLNHQTVIGFGPV